MPGVFFNGPIRRNMPRTKIIATLGPASDSPTVLLKMMRAGLDMVRLNFSHGTVEEHLRRIKAVRTLNKKYGRHLRILGDLEGHRVRIGKLPGDTPMELKKRQTVCLAKESFARAGIIPFDYEGPLSDIKKGSAIYIDDGTIALEAGKVRGKHLEARVIVGGLLKSRKGVNLPETHLSFKGVAHRDREALAFCLENRIDAVAQSFVRGKADILALRAFLKGADDAPDIIAKIEDREGIAHIDEIIKVCEGIMVARGDMGVSLPIWEVPMIQKAIIRKCNKAGKFVITATQMLESMVENRLPTRAEVSDVANAIIDGTDYVMLSAESAVGHDPAGCVDMMNRIIKFTEDNDGK